MFRTLTSQDFLCGSNTPEKPSFLEAEKDLVRRSSGKKEVGRVLVEEAPPPPMGGLKMALRAAAAVEEVGGLREVEEEEEEGSKTASRSQRHEGQNPVKCSSGWRSQEVEGRLG